MSIVADVVNEGYSAPLADLGGRCFIVAVNADKSLTVVAEIAVDVAVLRNRTVKLNARCNLKHRSAVSADACYNFISSLTCKRYKLLEACTLILDKTHKGNYLRLLIPLYAERHMIRESKNVVVCGIVSLDRICDRRSTVACVCVAVELRFV